MSDIFLYCTATALLYPTSDLQAYALLEPFISIALVPPALLVDTKSPYSYLLSSSSFSYSFSSSSP
jgi:hypothetical protein